MECRFPDSCEPVSYEQRDTSQDAWIYRLYKSKSLKDQKVRSA